MVSKIAVAALVLIMAVPTLLGYGLNIEQTTDTKYVENNESVNVTNMLQNSTGYNVVQSNVYDLNGRSFRNHAGFAYESGVLTRTQALFAPLYTTHTTSYSPVVFNQVYWPVGGNPTTSFIDGYDSFNQAIFYYGTSPATNYIRVTVKDSDLNVIQTINYVTSVSWNQYDGYLYVEYYADPPNHIYTMMIKKIASPWLHDIVPVNWDGSAYYAWWGRTESLETASSSSLFVDIAGGFEVRNDASDNIWWHPPTYFYNAVYTVDLNYTTPTLNDKYYVTLKVRNPGDLEDSSYTTDRGFLFEYIDRGNGPAWYMRAFDTAYTDYYKLPIQDNKAVFQIFADRDNWEIHYIGDWPKNFGIANYYYIVSGEWGSKVPESFMFSDGNFGTLGTASYKAKMRIDEATSRTSTYPTIENVTYSPSEIVNNNNNVTTISSISDYGDSIQFGGHTYSVRDGKITINSQSVPVEKIKFKTVNVGIGQYANMIGDTVVSTTASPSSIVFGGSWACNVATDTLSSESYTVDKWVPGHFAWNGLDDNFLFVGLCTAIAVFVGLGMYGRKSGAKVWPLMIVCGGAAALFLFML